MWLNKKIFNVAILALLAVFLAAVFYSWISRTRYIDIDVDYSDRYYELIEKESLTESEREEIRLEEDRVEREALQIFERRTSRYREANSE